MDVRSVPGAPRGDVGYIEPFESSDGQTCKARNMGRSCRRSAVAGMRERQGAKSGGRAQFGEWTGRSLADGVKQTSCVMYE